MQYFTINMAKTYEKNNVLIDKKLQVTYYKLNKTNHSLYPCGSAKIKLIRKMEKIPPNAILNMAKTYEKKIVLIVKKVTKNSMKPNLRIASHW